MIPEGARQHPKFIRYYITKDGRVWSDKRKIWLTKAIDRNGYYNVNLYHNKKKYYKKICRLTLETFVGLCPDGMECCHYDDDRKNDCLTNLRWGTRSDNVQDAIRNGTHFSDNRGSKSGRATIDEADARFIIYLNRTKQFTHKEIANIVGTTIGIVRSIVYKLRWKHIWKGN